MRLVAYPIRAAQEMPPEGTTIRQEHRKRGMMSNAL